MILDSKLMDLCGVIAQHFKTKKFIICYTFNEVQILSMNRSVTNLIQVKVNLNELNAYQPSGSMFVLPVERHDSIFDDKSCDNITLKFTGLRGFEITRPDDVRDLKAIVRFDKDLFDNDGFVGFPFENLIYELNQIEKHFTDKISRFHLRFGEYHSVLSVGLFNEFFFTNNIDKVYFKLLDSCNPVFVKYKCVFKGMLVNVYGMIAPVMNENYDYFIRVK